MSAFCSLAVVENCAFNQCTHIEQEKERGAFCKGKKRQNDNRKRIALHYNKNEWAVRCDRYLQKYIKSDASAIAFSFIPFNGTTAQRGEKDASRNHACKFINGSCIWIDSMHKTKDIQNIN